ncbi:4'-phosphopantetheinyl transferase [Kitasatospora sp. MAA4]|uniref:4'-phosphopantetheinyl transferase family protein n=1 Tax=Kitasatospora sp. MAA4 TaxID=3035093 RepID=UPI002475748B|nr:4'-phosphopantetheinyl transferase superfamily protein [Kitasatospora sp. MAA4]MDH6137083.1 4'-phosphopantetheinyl transferase [Kitasatospora sp. MAA4]
MRQMINPALTVEDEELDLWFLGPPEEDERPRALALDELDDAERKRAAGFVRPLDRVQYVAAHIALRRLLSVYTGVAPDKVRLGRDACPGCGGPHGRPIVLDAPGAPHFSLSHSHGLVLIAVSSIPVGVDVQRVPSVETAEICMTSLHPEEREELGSLTEEERSFAFGRLWTRKEAYLKGLGTGLTRGAGTDYLGEHGSSGIRPGGWTVRNLPACPSHIAAAALPTGEDRRASVRGLPADLLYSKDASEEIASAKAVVRTVLRAGEEQSKQ